jgi:hypothetical protein
MVLDLLAATQAGDYNNNNNYYRVRALRIGKVRLYASDQSTFRRPLPQLTCQMPFVRVRRLTDGCTVIGKLLAVFKRHRTRNLTIYLKLELHRLEDADETLPTLARRLVPTNIISTELLTSIIQVDYIYVTTTLHFVERVRPISGIFEQRNQ